ncbi:hypothetical protein MNBD_GAMMA26-1776 [hydrothermal vent metagenome]|uniref:YtkA-like domain-containing protein n=1 Tax=hydrothermal vent metagenome TaxID=652676 RepID=A0A3B1BFS6_9ZZZZ
MMNERKQSIAAFALIGLLAVTPIAFAAGEHDHDDHSGDHKTHDDHKDHDHDSKTGDMFLKKKEIDGYTVTFHVMKAKPGKEMGGSHDFMIKVEKDGKVLSNIAMNTKVTHPSGKSETKKTMKMGDWLMAGYDLGHDGKHQLMILFKTADGKKHKGGVYYPG